MSDTVLKAAVQQIDMIDDLIAHLQAAREAARQRLEKYAGSGALEDDRQRSAQDDLIDVLLAVAQKLPRMAGKQRGPVKPLSSGQEY